MKMLLTNDDGVEAPGLWTLYHALNPKADITVVAPATEQSGKGASITLTHNLTATRSAEKPCEAWVVNGTPADCIRFAMNNLTISSLDLVLAGINPGLNTGRYLFGSGTVGSVIEAVMHGIPGIAFSTDTKEHIPSPLLSTYIPVIVHHVLHTHPLPQGTFLNVSFPKTMHSHGRIAGIKFTRHEQSYAFDNERDSEGYWLEQGYITAVPVYVGELTHHTYLARAQQLSVPLNLSRESSFSN